MPTSTDPLFTLLVTSADDAAFVAAAVRRAVAALGLEAAVQFRAGLAALDATSPFVDADGVRATLTFGDDALVLELATESGTEPPRVVKALSVAVPAAGDDRRAAVVTALPGRHETSSFRELRSGLVAALKAQDELARQTELVRTMQQELDRTNQGVIALYAELEARAEELRRAKDASEAASRSKGAFLANMSHEIRTPLGAIAGFTELLLTPESTAAEHEQFARTILRNVQLLARLIDDVLDLSKVEAGKLELEAVPVALDTLLQDVLELFSARARQKGIALTLARETPLPPLVAIDPTRLKQVLINVVGNAVKFTAQGGVTLHARHAEVDGECGRLEVIVRDTGIGIGDAAKARLFQAFSQADASTTRRFGGTGLGLVLARRLAQLLGGDVALTASAPGRGSEMTVTCRTEKVAPGAGRVAAEAKRATDELTRLDGVRVLVADDAPDNRFMFARILGRCGAEVETADDGEEALQKALAAPFDVILMDVQMPHRDGLEATRALRAQGYTRPIVALTADAMKESVTASHAAGCDDHVAKPVGADALVRKVRELADGGAPAR